MQKLLFAAVFIGCSAQLYAQPGADSTTVAGARYENLGDYLRKGTYDFHFRTFAMGTINRGALSDYSTLAAGGGLGYYSPSLRGFHFGLSGFFAFQVFEHNVRRADPLTEAPNRYEILLYDMSNIENTTDLDRLDDLYIAYRKKGWQATFGRQRVNTPLLNEQDNRMRHNIFSGLTLTYRKGPWSAYGAWYNHVTMRGTVNWYRVEDSFGVYPFGRTPQGTPSGYNGNISSRGIAMAGLAYTLPDGKFKAQAWNYTAQNVFNVSLAQVDGTLPAGRTHFIYGLQGIYQVALNRGGNPESELTYIEPKSRGEVFGAKAGFGSKKSNVSLNFLRIGAKGRFLFPREWGREQLYVSLPRERHEGNGDVTAIVVKMEHQLKSGVAKGTETSFAMGAVSNPSLVDYRVNKYGMPSYYHFSGSLNYHFKGYLDGLEIKVLVVQKTAINPSKVEDQFRINRVDMWNFNTVVNYRF